MKKEYIFILVQGAKLKDPKCETALIKKFKPLMLSQVRKYIYDKNYYEDYLIEAEIILITSVKTFDETRGVPFPAYLKKQLFYYFSEIAKSYKPLTYLNAPLSNGYSCLLDTLCDETANIEEQLKHRALIEDLIQFYPQLGSRQQWLIQEHYLKGKTFTQMANEINVTSNSLVKLHRRTIKTLKQHFKLNFPS